MKKELTDLFKNSDNSSISEAQNFNSIKNNPC